uniref:Uncharacterized protein n=1 Tax=Candidatus Kentrum sp. DK TaxID=2126562 RepID=A0A450T783_9GAMM|nr:MAG: hypothetical protein BECKDK2373B_GA0170837_11105 [Candidatus Kentron sp. DK]
MPGSGSASTFWLNINNIKLKWRHVLECLFVVIEQKIHRPTDSVRRASQWDPACCDDAADFGYDAFFLICNAYLWEDVACDCWHFFYPFCDALSGFFGLS